MWDYRIWGHTGYYHRVAMNAMKGMASKQEEATLWEALRKNPEFAMDLGLGPETIPALVEFCPDLAYALLVALNTSAQIEHYFFTLFQMDLSASQVSFVSRLLEKFDLDKVYYDYLVFLGLERCVISSRENSKEKVWLKVDKQE